MGITSSFWYDRFKKTMGFDMRQLMIETCTERGVIACMDDQKLIFSHELPFGLNQSKSLMPDLAAALEKYRIKPESLTCIGVGIGPGSYTGIRIGVSVAQALAYSWKLPLVGVCSLDAFIPHEEGSFAALLDARIGGVYLKKGLKTPQGITYLKEPAAYPLEELGELLNETTVLVTPYAKMIQAKIDSLYPHNSWKWEEVPPSMTAFSRAVKLAFDQGLWKKEGHLELLYLRETEAERNKKM